MRNCSGMAADVANDMKQLEQSNMSLRAHKMLVDAWGDVICKVIVVKKHFSWSMVRYVYRICRSFRQ